jgi:hypothetical protein
MRLYLSLAAQTSDLESAIGQEAVDNSWLDSTPQYNNNNNNNWYENNSNANGSCRPTDNINFLDPQVSSSLCLHTLQRKSHLYTLFLGIARPKSQFPRSCVCERFLYPQDWSTYFLQQNRQIDCGNI